MYNDKRPGIKVYCELLLVYVFTRKSGLLTSKTNAYFKSQ